MSGTWSDGTNNAGFDPLSGGDLDSSTNNNSHGGDHLQGLRATEWKEHANKSIEEFLSRCPGAHGGYSEPSVSSVNPAGQDDYSNQVCCFVLYMYQD